MNYKNIKKLIEEEDRKKWEKLRLSTINPCSHCDALKRFMKEHDPYMITGEDAAKFAERCNDCTDYILWRNACFKKLAWYEENDERLKGD